MQLHVRAPLLLQYCQEVQKWSGLTHLLEAVIFLALQLHLNYFGIVDLINLVIAINKNLEMSLDCTNSTDQYIQMPQTTKATNMIKSWSLSNIQ